MLAVGLLLVLTAGAHSGFAPSAEAGPSEIAVLLEVFSAPPHGFE